MPLQLILGTVMILGFILAIFVGVIVSGDPNLQTAINLGIIFSPVGLVFFLLIRRHWLALGIGLIPLGIQFPVAALNRFAPFVYVTVCILTCVLGAFCFKLYQRKVIGGVPSMMMFFAFLIILARVIYDRPTSAMLGAGEGGAQEAFLYLFGMMAFWVYAKCAAENNWNARQLLWVLFALLAFAFFERAILNGVLGIGVRATDDGGGGVAGIAGIRYELYSRPAWCLYSLVLAGVIYFFRERKKSIWFMFLLLGFISFILVCSVLSGHRRTLLFALGSIAVITFVYKLHWKSWSFVGLGSVFALLFVIQTGPDILPGAVRRSLSLLIPVSEYEQTQLRDEITANEFGFENEFRKRIYGMAWQDIQANPVFGRGFTFDTNELMRMFAGSDQFDEAISRLVTVGGMHNANLFLATAAGLPCALLFTIGSIAIFVRGIFFARRLRDPQQRFLLVAVLGMVPPLYGHMVLNGSGPDFFRICMITGAILGMTRNPRFIEATRGRPDRASMKLEEASDFQQAPAGDLAPTQS